ncbi:protein of unknown function [Pseudodesulfovibrio piezophilus C1TLV30]|uniref:Uncharacterized protein n=1 Tax=Pseudodesulfovibrio piezophilus (strain DSM 21447 / JCM 15486 / C1TLV30) TaxID=1322246 RepID=M1WTE3_PSEP2|nr:protein of unknown function [Pseudodesulfovibrio piezophilus C1TLV30]
MKEWERDEAAVITDYLMTARDWKNDNTLFYNRDVIIAVTTTPALLPVVSNSKAGPQNACGSPWLKPLPWMTSG